MMHYDFDTPQVALRERLRDLIARHLSPDFPTIFSQYEWPIEEMERFVAVLAEEELLTMAWPEEYGGREASLWSQVVVSEEMWGNNEPRGPHYYGVNWLGPAIMRYGTAEQKAEHLPKLAMAQETWCQGFSEPDAGSDLASLQLRADRTADGFALDGQKIWTSYALLADWCIVAARTSSNGPKQHGITAFLIPMDRPGIEVRAIPTMLGPHHFHEVFFTDVPATEADVLGPIDEGWQVLRAGLSYERVGNARYARSDHILTDLRDHLRDAAEIVPGLQGRLAAATVHTQVARLLSYRVIQDRLESDEPSSTSASLARIASTTLDQEVADLAMEALGAEGLLELGDEGAPLHGHTEHHWRYAQASTVAAGTLEINKMLVARECL